MSWVWIQQIQKSARQRRPEQISQHNTVHVKNWNFILFEQDTFDDPNYG